MRHLRGKKIIVYKMRPKKKTRKKRGHRQELTRLMIDSISLNGKLLTAEPQTSATEVTPVSTETVTETTTEPTEVSSPVETIDAQIPETTGEVEPASEEKPENQSE